MLHPIISPLPYFTHYPIFSTIPYVGSYPEYPAAHTHTHHLTCFGVSQQQTHQGSWLVREPCACLPPSVRHVDPQFGIFRTTIRPASPSEPYKNKEVSRKQWGHLNPKTNPNLSELMIVGG